MFSAVDSSNLCFTLSRKRKKITFFLKKKEYKSYFRLLSKTLSRMNQTMKIAAQTAAATKPFLTLVYKYTVTEMMM